jgi:hypothetical protein
VINMHMIDQFDGTFDHRQAGDLRRWDVIFGAVRQVLDVTAVPACGVCVRTSVGCEQHAAAEQLWSFRPDRLGADACPQCGAEAGEPCDVTTCLGLAALEDAAEQAIEQAGDASGTAEM